ncbi:MAG: AAA family ATPase [Oscillospiraceae bacterium]|nr:MAG: AAA family ATPase [Oscillospiraceae bacterium]
MITNYKKLPTLLQSRKHWVLCDVPGAADPKHPRQAKHPQWGADSTNPATWADFATASAAVMLDDADGMGYVFAKDDGLVFIDGDHCLGADGRPLSPFDKWLTMLPGYCERSRSGTGLHFIVRGTLPDGCKHKKHINGGEMAVELYDCNRYVALTGNLWGEQTPLEDAPSAQAGIDVILQQMGMLADDGPADALPDQPDRPEEEIQAIIADALQRDGDFAQLWSCTEHPGKLGDESKDDLAICTAAWRATCFQLSEGDLMHGLDASPWAETKDNNAPKWHYDKWHGTGHRSTGDYRKNTALRAYKKAKQDEAAALDGFKSLAPEKPRFVTAAELDRMELPPVQWAVPGLLPAGLVFLVAAPKMGKSWLAFDLCLSVAAGDDWLGYETNQGATLYLALEDGLNRLQKRLKTIGDGFTPPPAGCTLAINAPMLNAGLLEFLDGWLTEHPDAKLVCIDTFQKVKPPQGKNENAYGADYRICSPLQAWAIQHNICVLLVHHTKKGVNPGDIFEGVNGSQGLTGTADATLLLSKENRFDADAVLSITGRDVEMERYLLHFNSTACRWVMLGTVDDQERQNFQACPAVKTIKELTAQGPWQGTVTELADEVLTRYPDAKLPVTPQGLGSYFNELWPSLKYQGIEHGIARGAKKRTHTLKRKS